MYVYDMTQHSATRVLTLLRQKYPEVQVQMIPDRFPAYKNFTFDGSFIASNVMVATGC